MVKLAQGEGAIVAMIGDGVDDAAAWAKPADLGLAMGTGTDVAMQALDLTLVSGDLRSAPDAIRLARSTWGTIKDKFPSRAFVYNVAALPLSLGGPAPDRRCRHGLQLGLRRGNSLRLRCVRPGPVTVTNTPCSAQQSTCVLLCCFSTF